MKMTTQVVPSAVASEGKWAIRVWPELGKKRLIRAWAGLRVMPEDNMAIYSRLPGHPNVTLVNTHSAVTMAAAHTRLLPDFILGGELPEICLDACKAAKARGLTISCDLNFRKKLWTSQRAGEVMSQLLPYVDVCIANEEDAKDVFGIEAEGTDVNSGKLNRDGYISVARQLSSRFGCKYVAITLRSSISANDNDWAGMLYEAAADKAYFSTTYHVHIVDRVGGGDSFGGGLIYSILTITLRVNQNVTGLALTIFGTGFGNFFGGSISKLAGGVGQISVKVTGSAYTAKIPGLSKIPVIGGILFNYGFLTYLCIIIAVLLSFFLFKTRAGLNLRAIGENPGTADAAGINVIKYKYLSTCIGAGLAGLGGLYFVMEYSGGTWTDNGFGDRGWLAVALVIFALWKPLNAIWGAFLFGALYILYLYIPGLGRSMQEVFKALPYVVTIIVLVFTSFRKKKEHQPPAALGLPYFREER